MCEGRTAVVVYLLLALFGVGVGCDMAKNDEPGPESTVRAVATPTVSPPNRFVVDLPCIDDLENCGPYEVDYVDAPGEELRGRAARDQVWSSLMRRLVVGRVRIEEMQVNLKDYEPRRKVRVQNRVKAYLLELAHDADKEGNDSAKIVEEVIEAITRGPGLDDAQVRLRVLGLLDSIQRGIDDALGRMKDDGEWDAVPLQELYEDERRRYVWDAPVPPELGW